MKRWIETLVLAGCIACGCAQPKGYVIEGTLVGETPTVYLTAVNQEGRLDTLQQARPQDGKFRFRGEVGQPQLYFLTLEGGKGRMPLFMEDTVFSVDIRKPDLGDVRNYTAQGGRLQQLKQELSRREAEIFKDRDSVLTRYYVADRERDMFVRMHEMAVLQMMGEQYDRVENEYIAANADNILGLGLVFYRYRFLNHEQFKPKYELLSEAMKNTPEGRLITRRYELLSGVKVGAQAPDFKLPTLSGDTVQLHATSARVKIIDFWASWCGPCRRENPHLVEIARKYKDKDLLLISVSIDTDEKAWREAVKTDGLSWTQACDLKGVGGPVAKAYRISAIPHIFILDGTNRIVAEGVRGKEIEEVVSKMLK